MFFCQREHRSPFGLERTCAAYLAQFSITMHDLSPPRTASIYGKPLGQVSIYQNSFSCTAETSLRCDGRRTSLCHCTYNHCKVRVYAYYAYVKLKYWKWRDLKLLSMAHIYTLKDQNSVPRRMAFKFTINLHDKFRNYNCYKTYS